VTVFNGLPAGTVCPTVKLQPWMRDGDQAADHSGRGGYSLVRRLVASVAQFDAAVRKLLL
jgi:hypothetical protein